MAPQSVSSETDSLPDILLRAFDNAAFPPQAAEIILQAQLTPADLNRADELLERKRDTSLTTEENALLRDYLLADLILTTLKSKARQALNRN